MTTRLQHDIEALKIQLARAQSDSPQGSAFRNGSGKENDKVFFDAATVNKAHEKLREFSVVSPKSSSSPPDYSASPVVSAVGKRYSGSARLPSISEDVGSLTGKRRVSIAEPTIINHSVHSSRKSMA